MLYHRNLRVQLQERRNRLYRCRLATYDSEFRYLFQFLDSNSYIKSLLDLLEISDAVDFERWYLEHEDARYVQFPESEEGRAKVCYGILKADRQ